MMSKEFLKKLGILGISFGLAASPLAFAEIQEEEDEFDPVQEQVDDYAGSGVDIEYENEEEEWEEENEEEEWEEENEEEEWEDEEGGF